jgi:hypothetical protein
MKLLYCGIAARCESRGGGLLLLLLLRIMPFACVDTRPHDISWFGGIGDAIS